MLTESSVPHVWHQRPELKSQDLYNQIHPKIKMMMPPDAMLNNMVRPTFSRGVKPPIPQARPTARPSGTKPSSFDLAWHQSRSASGEIQRYASQSRAKWFVDRNEEHVLDLAPKIADRVGGVKLRPKFKELLKLQKKQL